MLQLVLKFQEDGDFIFVKPIFFMLQYPLFRNPLRDLVCISCVRFILPYIDIRSGVSASTEAKVVKRATVPVSIPLSIVEKLEHLRVRLGYRSRNEVIREALRRFVEEMDEAKVLYLRNVTVEQAKREITEYLKRHSSAYVSEMAENLGIGIELAFEAVEQLEKEGIVGE